MAAKRPGAGAVNSARLSLSCSNSMSVSAPFSLFRITTIDCQPCPVARVNEWERVPATNVPGEKTFKIKQATFQTE